MRKLYTTVAFILSICLLVGCYARQAEKYSFDLLRFLNPLELPNIRGSVNLDALVTGTYRCTFTATVSTGDEVMFRDFSITME